jgi:hypothetical protein
MDAVRSVLQLSSALQLCNTAFQAILSQPEDTDLTEIVVTKKRIIVSRDSAVGIATGYGLDD